MVQKIATAMLDDVLSNGTVTWDVGLLKVASIVLCAALETRVGDITKARRDTHPLSYLSWNDVKIQLVGGTEIEDFT